MQTGDQAGSPTGLLGYDVLNRLSDVKYNTNTTNHLLAAYRSDGLRASKTVNVGGTSGAPTYFLYDGTRVVCELSGNGGVGASYGYGAAGLAQTYNGVYTAYCYDPMGNVTCRVPQLDNTNAGQTQPAYDFSVYDAFGSNVVYLKPRYNTVTSFPPDDHLSYGAQWGNYTDAETGLILMGWRYYSPIYCRFLTRDPSGYEGGINVYAYCRNNPIMFADPTGLWGEYDEWLWHRFVHELKPALQDAYNAVRHAAVATGHIIRAQMEAKIEFGDPSAMPESDLPMGQEPEAFLPEAEVYGPSTYGHLSNPRGVGPGKRFTTNQVKAIYADNMKRNGGVLKSDTSGDVLVRSGKSMKSVNPPANEAQIDHIIPRQPASGRAPGTNSNNNAQVISRAENRQKSNR